MTNVLQATRRTVLTATGTTLTGLTLAGCTSIASTSNEETPDEAFTVTVGPDGKLIFNPDNVRVQPETAVRWKWESDNHNIVVERQPDEAEWTGTPGEPSKTYDKGYTYEYTFSTIGPYKYYCQPHRNVAMSGKIMVTKNASSPVEQSYDDFIDARGKSEVSVEVGPGGELVFEPENVRLSTDTTLRWVWKTDNHNIVVGEQPEEADWPGHKRIEYEGYTYTHTFSVKGRYNYWCRPHKSVGMTGTLLVE